MQKIYPRIKFLFTFRSLNRTLQEFIKIFGVIWLFIEALSFFFQETITAHRLSAFTLTVFFSIAISVYLSFPRLSYTCPYRKSNLEISISVGDLLVNLKDGTSHIVIGSHNHFTLQESQISGRSLRSQVVKAFYDQRGDRLDRKIIRSLPREKIIGKVGKTYKVAVGSVAVVELGKSKAFFLINQQYDHKNRQLYDMQKEDIWLGLCNLWAAVKSNGNQLPIAVPILGAKIGKAPASRMSLVQLILISFAIANRSAPITERLTVVINPDDYSPGEMFEIIRFMDGLDL